MRVNLKDLAKDGKKTQIQLELIERLPSHIEQPCILTVDYQVSRVDDYYLIDLHTRGEFQVSCMRCTEPFTAEFDNQTQLAVCRNESRAEELIHTYECIVSTDHVVDLYDLVCDELHLYAPEVHENKMHCHLVID